MQPDKWKLDFETELEKADQVRQNGNEGQARVCARRAAGAAIREYCRRRTFPADGLSAYDLINLLKGQSDLPETARQILTHLSTRVDPGGILPLPVDLIAETRLLPQILGLTSE